MKFLLCSSGVSNPSIHAALVELLGKPICESNALCMPTAGSCSLPVRERARRPDLRVVAELPGRSRSRRSVADRSPAAHAPRCPSGTSCLPRGRLIVSCAGDDQ